MSAENEVNTHCDVEWKSDDFELPVLESCENVDTVVKFASSSKTEVITEFVFLRLELPATVDSEYVVDTVDKLASPGIVDSE